MYYGFIEEIWELDYGLEELKVPLFRCKWVRVPKGTMMDKYRMRTVDFKHLAYLDEPFVFAKDVVQVFYGKNLGDGGGGHVVLQGKRKIVGVKDTNEEEVNGHARSWSRCGSPPICGGRRTNLREKQS